MTRAVALLIVFGGGVARGEDPPQAQNPPAVREEIVVTAERGPEPRAETPAAVSVLTREEISRLPADDLAGLIPFLPGFHVLFPDRFGGLPMVSSRGFFGGGEAEYVQLLIDGVPVSDVESGLADWGRIRAADIERIEALRGPASSLYGDTALGGVVQVFTRHADREGQGGLLSLSGGSFGSASGDFGWHGGLGPVRGGFAATLSRTDGFRDHAASEEGGLDVSLERAAGPGRWTLAVSGSSRDREEPGPLTREQLRADRSGSDPLFRFDREETQRGRVSVAYLYEGSAGRARAGLYGTLRETDFLRTILVAPGLGDRTFRTVETNSLGGTLEGEKSFRLFSGAAPIRAGLDFARERLETDYRAVSEEGAPGERVAVGSGKRDRLAFFFSGGWHVSPRVRLTAGLRWDRIADAFSAGDRERSSHNAWSPRAGLNVRVGPESSPTALFFQVSRAFKAPTLDQLFDPRPFSDFMGGTFVISNSDLSPQRAETVELGASRRTGAAFWELAAYRTDVEDEIDFDAATFRYRNIGRSRHVGLEVSGRFFETSAVSPSLSYAWTRVEAQEGENRGRQLKNIPEHVLRAGLSAKLPAGILADARYTYMAGRFLDDASQFPLEDASVLDLRLERAFGPVRARLDLLNATDEKFSALGFALSDFSGEMVAHYSPAPGFAARVGLEWSF